MEIREKLSKALAGKQCADIVIIGKGASIDAVHVDLLKDKIIINVNDSESIICGDIGVFHHDWVLDYLANVQPGCKLYVTDRSLPLHIPVLQARFVAQDAENDLFMERFFDAETLWLESTAVINCLRVANEVAKHFEVRKRVFLLGFDFSLDAGFSSKIKNGLHGKDDMYVGHVVRFQEAYLEMLIKEEDRLNIDIIHVGARPYSLFSVNAFNALLRVAADKSFSFVKSPTKDDYDHDVKVVAEITTNHFGDNERLKAMILLAKQAGADFIKLQKRHVETFYKEDMLKKSFKSPFGETFRDYRSGLELTIQDFEWVDLFCRKIGIGWFASILDEFSFDFIKQFDPPLIKIPSTISERKNYLERVGEEWVGGLVISTGMTDIHYENFILNSFKNSREIYLLQCTSAYPTPEIDAGIGIIRHYRDLSKQDSRIIPGYSSHDIGSICSQMAVAAGARMIEKHVKLGSVQWAHFDEVALDLATDEFSNFVKDVRRAQVIVGAEYKKIRDSEHHKY